MTSFRSLALVSLVGLVVVGCSKESSPPPTAPTPAAPTVNGVTVTGYSGTALNRPNQTVQLSASARYSDGSTRDVTGTAAWRSDNPGVAEVSPSGLVTARNDGEATVAADVQGVAGNVRLRVAIPRRAEPQVTGTIDVRPSPEPIFLFRAEMTLAFRERSQAVGMNVNFVNVTWRDYDNKLLIFRNYTPGDLAQIWGNNHIAAGSSRGIVARIDYSRPLSRVSVLVETSVQDDYGNIINFSETFRDSVGVRAPAPLSLFDLHRPPVLVDERTGLYLALRQLRAEPEDFIRLRALGTGPGGMLAEPAGRPLTAKARRAAAVCCAPGQRAPPRGPTTVDGSSVQVGTSRRVQGGEADPWSLAISELPPVDYSDIRSRNG